MAVSVLTRAFRRLSIFKNDVSIANISTQQIKLPVRIAPLFLRSETDVTKQGKGHTVLFTPHSLNLNFNIPRPRIPPSSIKCPVLPVQINDPLNDIFEKNDIKPNITIEIPPDSSVIEKRAERLIVIRRKKMKKHQRRKHLKRMQFILRKRKHEKKQLKQKIFEAELHSIHQEAETFDPKKYVASRLQILDREVLPNRWRGEKLPESMIRQFMEEKQKRMEHKHRLRTYRLRPDLSKAALQKNSTNLSD